MIELIFAIVVISIVVMSLPVMIQMTSKGVEDNIVQEAIFAASAELMGATSYYWDANSMQDNSTSHLSRVIDIENDCNTTASSSRHRLRPGHIAQPYHRRCLDNPSTGRADDSNDTFPNIDNYIADNDGELIFENEAAEGVREAGYKKSYKTNLSISYIDGEGNAENNIKKVTVMITDSDDKNITKLNVYSANIGEIDYYKRRF